MIEQNKVGLCFRHQLFYFRRLAFTYEIFWIGCVPTAGGRVQYFSTRRCNQFNKFGQVFASFFIAGIHVYQNGAITQLCTFKQARSPQPDSSLSRQFITLYIQ